MPFLHLLSIDWSALTAVYAMWTMRKGTAALAEGGRDALSRIQSAFHTSVFHTHGCICFRGFASADATRVAFQSSP